jgi:CDGSH-type Zn-finger protein
MSHPRDDHREARTKERPPMSDETVTITVRPNGPYLVKGPIELVDGDGHPFEVAAGKTIALCRCGGSTTKPFCDGTHSKAGFDAATSAVRRMDEAEAGSADA